MKLSLFTKGLAVFAATALVTLSSIALGTTASADDTSAADTAQTAPVKAEPAPEPEPVTEPAKAEEPKASEPEKAPEVAPVKADEPEPVKAEPAPEPEPVTEPEPAKAEEPKASEPAKKVEDKTKASSPTVVTGDPAPEGAPSGSDANQAKNWKTWLEGRGYTNVACYKVDGLRDPSFKMPFSGYLLLVLKGGTVNEVVWNPVKGTSYGLTSGKDLSHVIKCTGEKEEPTFLLAQAEIVPEPATCDATGSAEWTTLINADGSVLDQTPGTHSGVATADEGAKFSDDSTTKTVEYTIQDKLPPQSTDPNAPCYEEPAKDYFLELSGSWQCKVGGGAKAVIALRNVSPWIYPASYRVDSEAVIGSPDLTGPYGPVVNNLGANPDDQTGTKTFYFAEDSGTHTIRFAVRAGTESDLWNGQPAGVEQTLTIDTDCLPPAPLVVTDHGDWVDGQWVCGDIAVTQTRKAWTITTPYLPEKVDGQWVLDTENAVRTDLPDETQTRQLTREEITERCTPDPFITYTQTEWVDGSYKCDATTVTQTAVKAKWRVPMVLVFAEDGSYTAEADYANAVFLSSEVVKQVRQLDAEEVEACPVNEPGAPPSQDESDQPPVASPEAPNLWPIAVLAVLGIIAVFGGGALFGRRTE